MPVRRLVLLAALGVLVGALAWSLTQAGGSSGGAAPTSAAETPPARTPRTPQPTGPAAPTATASPGTAGGTGTHGAKATAHPSGFSGNTEIIPAPSSAASAAAGPRGLKHRKMDLSPLVSLPLPPAGVAKGSMVAGYPHVLAPPAKHAIAVSSVSPAGTTLQSAVTASCTRPCDVLKVYRLRLAARGFSEVPAAGVENRPTAAFHRQADSITVAVTGQTTHAVSYTVFSVLHTGATSSKG